ncbi:MAG: hypothetical protein C1O27_000328 [Chloroflexi bacterium]|jgi:hypothetical protein|nr:MAG: hypothetical protein C1O27_000328 [Chloroflexota bacterium]
MVRVLLGGVGVLAVMGVGALVGATLLKSDNGSTLPASASEGIHVSALWNIDVLADDGTVVDSREFHNALTDGGRTLTYILARIVSVGEWQVELHGVTSEQPCENGGLPVACVITENALTGSTFPHYFQTLTVDRPVTGDNAGYLVLSGTADAQRAGSITRVTTDLASCDSSVAPDNPCPVSLAGNPFSEAYSSSGDFTAIDVLAGQRIAVQILMSFQ